MISPDLLSPDEGGDTLSDAERKAVAEADEWLKHNQPVPHEEVLAEFSLTMADWEKMDNNILGSSLEMARESRSEDRDSRPSGTGVREP